MDNNKRNIPGLWRFLLSLAVMLAILLVSDYVLPPGQFVKMYVVIAVVTIAFVIWGYREFLLHPRAIHNLNQGWAKQHSGDYEGAKANYREAIRRYPTFSQTYINRGCVLMKEQDFDGALADFSRVIELGDRKKVFYGYFNRCQAHYYKKTMEPALADIDEAIRLRPRYVDAHMIRGQLLYEQKKYDQAIDSFSRAIEIGKPTEVVARAHNNRACAYSSKGILDKALEDANRAIQLNPKMYNGYCTRGGIMFELQNYEQALADYKKVINLKPDQLSCLAGQAIALHALGQFDEAIQIWNTLIEKDEQYHDIAWVEKELDWTEPHIGEARKLIARLST